MHTRRSESVLLKTLIGSLIAALIGCLVMVVFAGRLGGIVSSLPLRRSWMLSQGRIPYVDFEWAYGVSFLYVPDLLHHLLHLNLV